MPAIDTKIWLALRKRIETLSLTPAHAIAWPNSPVTPPQADGVTLPYIAVQFMPNRPIRININPPVRHRYVGILQISAMYPLAGVAETKAVTYSTELAGLIAEHFPADLKLVQDGETVRITEQPDVSQGFRDTAEWKTPISIRYECIH